MNTGYDYKQFAILYIDDEEMSLKYFKKLYEKKFNIITASSVADARKIIAHDKNKTIGVVISDQRLRHGEIGVEYLTELRSSRKDIVRILATAYTEIADAIKAVNEGAIYKYIEKPWNNNTIKTELLKAMEFYIVQRERDALKNEKLSSLQKIVLTDRIQNLTTLAMSLSNQFNSPLTALKSYLEACPIKTRKPLNDANSSVYEDVSSRVLKDNRRMITAIQQLSNINGKYDEMKEQSLKDILQSCIDRSESSVKLDLTAALPQVTVNASTLERFFQIIMQTLASGNLQSNKDMVLTAENTTLDNKAEGLKIVIKLIEPSDTTEMFLNSIFAAFDLNHKDPEDMKLNMLVAYFIIHHHGGSLKFINDQGLGFEITLPLNASLEKTESVDSDQILDALYTQFEKEDLSVLAEA